MSPFEKNLAVVRFTISSDLNQALQELGAKFQSIADKLTDKRTPAEDRAAYMYSQAGATIWSSGFRDRTYFIMCALPEFDRIANDTAEGKPTQFQLYMDADNYDLTQERYQLEHVIGKYRVLIEYIQLSGYHLEIERRGAMVINVTRP